MKSYKVFKKPYVLIEDFKNKFQPFYKEYVNSDAPKLHLDSPTLCCPFQATKKYKQSNKRRHTREGFCEICYTRFSNYEEHIKEFEHREFAKDNSNYKKLDAFISTSAFESASVSEEYTPQSPTFRMTPASSGRNHPGVCSNGNEKYSQTLHFSPISTEDCREQEVVLFDHFIAEVFDK
ncbi:protein kinase [Encephalitozoon intestinalis ATCC 50506]|uniref:Protein kinase n=1 Tax=Encephalitozoon intestinalis (strain ATCC 50506) TaxID=876142 RepID=E0S700_ENCIT|nr:protein kinase [Encephalitozoon intestinalis ATCC 50506]ADM11586.1 protein kinase [Encephalitozoon intestinalis ATCC 50506]UTX45304.1 zinc-finger domain-containing protein [Encephalitozoon intestinalis]